MDENLNNKQIKNLKNSIIIEEPYDQSYQLRSKKEFNLLKRSMSIDIDNKL